MKGLLVIAFWCWFAVSLGILFRRGVRRVGGGSQRAAKPAPGTDSGVPSVLASLPPLPDPDATPLPDPGATSVGTAAAGTAAQSLAGDAVAETATARVDPLAPGGPPTETAAANSIFVRETPSAPTLPRPTRGGRSIGDALQGIRMPCDLMPLTGSQADFDRRAAFVTVGYPAEAVAPELADEIERLGMAFNALTENTAMAERDDVRVKIAVRSVGASVNGVADPVYPTAPEHSVVVEFELV